MNRDQQLVRKQNIAAFLESGGSVRAAARKWNITRATVYSAARLHGVTLVRITKTVGTHETDTRCAYARRILAAKETQTADKEGAGK